MLDDGAALEAAPTRVFYRILNPGILVAAFFAITAVIGILRLGPDLPYGDDWWTASQIGRAYRVEGAAALVRANNGHRATLAYVMGWIDLEYGAGLGRIPRLASIGLLLATVLALGWAVGRLVAGPGNRGLRISLVALTAMLCFSWHHALNLTWAVQVLYFGSNILPLFAFLALARVASPEPARSPARWTAIAIVLAAASELTMGNGVLVAPLLMVLGLALGVRGAQRAALAAAAIVLPLLFFYGIDARSTIWGAPPEGFALARSLTAWAARYLGNFWTAVAGWNGLAVPAGLLYLILTAIVVSRGPRDRDARPIFLGLSVFLVFLVLTAAGGAWARVGGPDVPGGLALRYRFASALGWAVLAILLVAAARPTRRLQIGVPALIALFALVLLPVQLAPLTANAQDPAFRLRVAGLALELDIVDPQYRVAIVPEPGPNGRSVIVPWWTRNRRGAFGAYPLCRAEAALGVAAPNHIAVTTVGVVDRVTDLAGGMGWQRVEGWAFAPAGPDQIERVLLSDRSGSFVGVAVTGRARPDLVPDWGPRSARRGFVGYLRPGADRASLKLQIDPPGPSVAACSVH